MGGASGKDAGPIQGACFVVFKPLLEALLVEDMFALLDGAEPSVLDKLGQADWAFHIEHVFLEIQTVDIGIVPAHCWSVPVGHAF